MAKLTGPSINLAKNRGEKFVDRFLKWALTTGRVMIILTEAAALAAFLYRFGLDRQNIALHDQIKQQQAIVDLLKNNEATYRNLQDRLQLAKVLDTDAQQSIKAFQDIVRFIPSDMFLRTLEVSDTTVHIDGDVHSIIELSDLVKKLKSYPGVDSVSVDKIENKGAQGTFSTTITVTFKKKLVKPSLI